MTMTDTTRRLENRLKTGEGFIGGLTKRFANYKTYRTTLEELQNLSDRELADLGIHRSTLRSIAYRAAYDG